MIRKSLFLFLAAAAPVLAQTPAPTFSPSFSARKEFGILLLIENVDVRTLRRAALQFSGVAKKYPLEIALAPTDSGDLQQKVDTLQSSGVQKIVVVPLFISYQSDDLQQARYLLRLEPQPAKALTSMPNAMWAGVKKVDAKVPIVMDGALATSPLFTSMIIDRAKTFGGDPLEKTVVMVGCRPDSKRSKAWETEISALSDNVRRFGAFKEVRGFGIDCLNAPIEGSPDEKNLRRFIDGVKPVSSALVVPLEVYPTVVALRVPDLLQGLFYRFDGRTGYSGSALSQWVTQAALEGAKLPDQRLKEKISVGDIFKNPDAASKLPPSSSH
jgi:hypothetical protein